MAAESQEKERRDDMVLMMIVSLSPKSKSNRGCSRSMRGRRRVVAASLLCNPVAFMVALQLILVLSPRSHQMATTNRVLLPTAPSQLFANAATIDAETGGECVDSNEKCPFWAATGECEKNSSYMHTNCKLSCDRCNVIRVNNQAEINRIIAQKRKEIEAKREIKRKEKEVLDVLQNRGGGGGRAQAVEGGKDSDTSTGSAAATATNIANSGSSGGDKAQQTAMAAKTKPTKPKKIDAETGLECVDKDEENCPKWAAAGNCKKNRNFMSVNCKLSCDRCQFVRVKNQNDISKFISRKNKEKENKENAKERILKARDVTLNKHGNQGSAGHDEL